MKASIISNYLFSKSFSPQEIKWQKMPDVYVSEAIGRAEISKWRNYILDKYNPQSTHLLISAQTGRGKNHFVTTELIPFARANGEEVLYISNRVALDNQQKKKIARATHTAFPTTGDNQRGYDYENTFGNVTVITYQRLLGWFASKDEEWFRRFRYVIIDECHFFYSDALFNAHTGYILESIVRRFTFCVRIYMTATFEDVIKPIQYYEGKYSPRILGEFESTLSEAGHFYDNSFAYEFPRDFSNCKCKFFTDTDQIVELIRNSKASGDKWMIFVTAKRAGKELCEKLEKAGISACYIDRDSKNDPDYMVRAMWVHIVDTGTLPKHVLITTSVLDNGFSICDHDVKNIVICSDDKTEFLQENGRFRADKTTIVNLYIRKLDNKRYAQMKKQYESLEVFCIRYYGGLYDEDPEMQSKYTSGGPISVVKSIWHNGYDEWRSYITLIEANKGILVPQANLMVRWRTIRLGEKIAEYEEYLKNDPETASVLFKADLVDADHDEMLDTLSERDIDRSTLDFELDKLLNYLDKYVVEELDLKKGKEFEEFSKEFMTLYASAFPDDSSVNLGKNRSAWQEKAINSHLEKVNEHSAVKNRYALVQPDAANSNIWQVVYVSDVEEE